MNDRISNPPILDSSGVFAHFHYESKRHSIRPGHIILKSPVIAAHFSNLSATTEDGIKKQRDSRLLKSEASNECPAIGLRPQEVRNGNDLENKGHLIQRPIKSKFERMYNLYYHRLTNLRTPPQYVSNSAFEEATDLNFVPFVKEEIHQTLNTISPSEYDDHTKQSADNKMELYKNHRPSTSQAMTSDELNIYNDSRHDLKYSWVRHYTHVLTHEDIKPNTDCNNNNENDAAQASTFSMDSSLCAICQDKSSGLHYGIFTCEGFSLI